MSLFNSFAPKSEPIFYNKNPAEIFQLLHSRAEGLSSDEVQTIKKTVGMNKIPKRKTNLYEKYIKPVFNLMVIILFIAALVQLYLTLEYNPGEFPIGPIVVLFILFVNIIIGFRQQYKAEKTLEALERLTAFKARVLRENQTREIESDQVVPGDILILHQGDYICADARLIQVFNLTTNESVLTGESMPVEKSDEILSGEKLSLQEQKNMIFNSTFITSGTGRAIVTATGINTEIGKISKQIAQKEKRQIPLQKNMNYLATALGFFVLGVILVLFLIQVLLHPNLNFNIIGEIQWLVSLAVAAIPFNFPIITTIILLTGVIYLAREQAIVRNLNAVETMGRLSVVCTDKTGTLTQNEMTVQKIFYNNSLFTVSGTGYNASGKISLNGEEINVLQDLYLWKMLLTGVINNNAELIKEQVAIRKGSTTLLKVIGIPTEAALLTLAQKANIDPKLERSQYEVLREISFSSERKMMSKIVKREGRFHCFTKGAPEVILNRCSQIALNNRIAPLESDMVPIIAKQIELFAKEGLRTLALAFRNFDSVESLSTMEEHDIERDLVFLGIIGMVDPPREGVIEAIQVCKDAHIKVVMITGDHPTTAKAIAERIKILPEQGIVVSGKDLKSLPVDQIVDTTVFARVAPEDKNIIIKAFQSRGEVVAMTGDGVNDAVALENADVGIAMGIAGTDVAKNAADLVLTDDSFITIKTALYHGRGVFNNIRSNIVFLLVCDLMELLVLVAISLAFGNKIFFQLQLTFFYATVHFFPPLGLMFDKYDPNLMKEPPKKAKESLINTHYRIMMGVQIMVIAGVILALWIIITNGLLPIDPINARDVMNRRSVGYAITEIYKDKYITFGPGSPDLFLLPEFKARTICFIVLILSELWVSIEARSVRYSMFKGRQNWLLTFFWLFVLLLLIFVTQFDLAQAYMGLIPLTPLDWAITVASSLVVIVVTEIFKLFIKKS